MSSPPIPAGPVAFPNGPGQPADNLTGLANGKALGLGMVGTAFTQYFDCIVASIFIKSGTGTSGTGTVSLYLVVSEDGTHWSGGIDPTSTSDQSAKLAGQTALQEITVGADATEYYFNEFSFSNVLSFMPTFMAVVIWNKSGAALDTTPANFYAASNLVSYP